MGNSWKGEKKHRGKLKAENPKRRRIDEIIDEEHEDEIVNYQRHMLQKMPEGEELQNDMP